MCTLLYYIKNEEINGREGQREIEDEGKAVERERDARENIYNGIQSRSLTFKSFNIVGIIHGSIFIA